MSSNTNNTTTTPSTSSGSGQDIGKAIKAPFAAVHGLGETLRGTVNGAVDEIFNPNGNSSSGIAKNDKISQDGMKEFESGKFSANTVHKETTTDGRGI